MYERETRGVVVRVEPEFLESQSSPEDSRFVWAYTIEIENRGGDAVQLMSRWWRIMDAEGRVQEVRGPGVVGEQPVLKPGETFKYTSGAPLGTPSGLMSGSYQMRDGGGEDFDVEIPAFSLDSPHERGNLRPH